jgi:predicted lysophospholipase L1 biosynthesis ABC-type transport system permease subunit
MASLSYATAARIATRELRSSRGKFAFVVLSVAIGVAALTGVRGFSSAFRATLLLRARSIMAADIAARTNVADSRPAGRHRPTARRWDGDVACHRAALHGLQHALA